LNPDLILSLPGILSLVAEMARPGDFPALRLVLVGGETMTPLMRERIEAGFKVPVIDAYSSHEFIQIAVQCPKSGLYHVSDDQVLLEVLVDGRPAREGERGEVVGTALHSFSMPFIRYRLGDLAVRGPERCPCGAPYSTLERIEGRVSDFLPMPDGRKLHPFELIRSIAGQFGWISQFRIIQEDSATFTLLIRPLTAPPAGAVELIEKQLGGILGSAVRLNLATVESIPLTSSGKMPVCISKVTSGRPFDW